MSERTIYPFLVGGPADGKRVDERLVRESSHMVHVVELADSSTWNAPAVYVFRDVGMRTSPRTLRVCAHESLSGDQAAASVWNRMLDEVANLPALNASSGLGRVDDCNCGYFQNVVYTRHASNPTGHAVGCPVYERWRAEQT